jgi:hypothetical protein
MTFCTLLTHPSLDAVFADPKARSDFSDRAITFLYRTHNLLSQVDRIRLHFCPTFTNALLSSI